MNANILIPLGLAAWAWLSGKKTPAAPAAQAPGTNAPRPRPKPAAKPDRTVRVPEVTVTAPVPTSTVQPVSANAVPWPAVEQKVLNRPQAQSTARYRDKGGRTAVLNVEKHTGSNPQDEMAAVVVRERNPFDRDYWTPATKVSPEQIEQAKAYISIWQKGAVWYDGPRTFLGRRQYRAAMHGAKKAVEVWQPKRPFGNESTVAPAAARSTSAAAPSGPPTLRQGSSGNDVAFLQKLLGLPQDGKFGPNTKAAVVAFQSSKGLAADGIVGRQSWTALGAIK